MNELIRYIRVQLQCIYIMHLWIDFFKSITSNISDHFVKSKCILMKKIAGRDYLRGRDKFLRYHTTETFYKQFLIRSDR